MALARRVGLGLASRGKVSDCVAWAERARSTGVESVWFHDSYFERDAVTYASAVASQVEEIGVGLGSPLPLRLGQMGIPYAPDDAATRTVGTIDTLHTLWKGERLPPGKPGLPPLQPMFPPVHRVPIYVAGYRSPMMVVAGQKGDGYLARPAESIPGLRKLLRVMDRAARDSGRDPDAIDVAGYLLTFIDETRRDALNRAKRDPFVIYMMSILSDVTLRRAGFEPENRDRIATKWRGEDYTGAGALIADELLDAYILCGTRREVAERAHAYHEAGMDLPLLQPVVQEEAQVQALLEAALLYGSAEVGSAARVSLEAQRKTFAQDARNRLGGLWEIARPFSFTASTVPVAAGGALAALAGAFNPLLFLASLIGAVALHVGTNVTNEIYDVRKGVDTIVSPRASHAIVKGRI